MENEVVGKCTGGREMLTKFWSEKLKIGRQLGNIFIAGWIGFY
jgi:hypothetical protein